MEPTKIVPTGDYGVQHSHIGAGPRFGERQRMEALSSDVVAVPFPPSPTCGLFAGAAKLVVPLQVVAVDDGQHSFVTHFRTETSHTSQSSVEAAVECLVLAGSSFAVVPPQVGLWPHAKVEVPGGERVR